MKKHLSAIFACILFTSSVNAVSAAQQLLLPGSFHGEEVTAKNGEKWIAVSAREKRKVTLRVSAVKDLIVDEGNKKTGKGVSTPGIQSIFLVKDIPNVSAGKCIAVLSHERELWKKPPVKLSLGKRHYTIEVKLKIGTAKQGDTYTPAHCDLVVSEGSSKETILSKDCVSELQSVEAPRILWAGDLDADGKLDLLIDGATETNVSSVMLYTSSARKGKLLTKVAEFTTYGC